MKWIAPSAKDSASATLEKNLWNAADQFRANSGLTAQEYAAPILGLIFLRFAEVRFLQKQREIAQKAASSRMTSMIDPKLVYVADGILFLPPHAQFQYLLNLPEGEDVGKALNQAMKAIELENTQIAGILPQTYHVFASGLLKGLLRKIAEIPDTLDFDAFGRVYEYFLGAFAMSEGQGGGEFYTPASIVTLLTEVIEPYHGRILDPACGSGGMFVQSARFVSERIKDPARELSIYGIEKTDITGRIVVHYQRTSRASYLWYEDAMKLPIHEIRAKQVNIKEFTGFANVLLMHNDLKAIMQHPATEWKMALSHTKGIYVITDTQSGQHYVGQTAGAGGF